MDSERSDNWEKRVLYSECELLKMEIEEAGGMSLGGAGDSSPRKDGGNAISVLREQSLEELQQLSEALKLGFVRRRRQWWDKIDEITRLVGVWLVLMIFAIFFAPLGILLRPLDYLLAVSYTHLTLPTIYSV